MSVNLACLRDAPPATFPPDPRLTLLPLRSVPPGRRGPLLVHNPEGLRGRGDPREGHRDHPAGGRRLREAGPDKRRAEVGETLIDPPQLLAPGVPPDWDGNRIGWGDIACLV